MSVQRIKKENINAWSSKFSLENSKTSHQLPVLTGKPNISYSVLKQLCSIDALGNRKRHSTKEAHDTFMKNYSRIFLPSEERLPVLKPSIFTTGKLDNGSLQRNSHTEVYIPFDHHKPHYCSDYNYSISHDIRDHLALLHKQHLTHTKDSLLNARIQSLRKLLRKLPFERKRSEQEAIFNHLQYFTELTDQIPLELLKEISTVVQLEKWHEADYLVFGKNELYLILKGVVAPLDDCFSSHKPEDQTPSLSSTQSLTEVTETKLVAGQCFGVIKNVERPDGSDSTSRITSVVTLGPCEFLKISARDFEKMKQLIDSKETTEKLNLIQSCRLFQNWPKVALNKIVDLIGWKTFHPGTVLVNEGESCQVIGFIGDGVCLLKRTIDVAKTRRDGTKDRRQKRVTIGKLGPGDSFGECAVLRDQPISYSIVTATQVHLGVISEDDFHQMDDVTKCLLSQSCETMDNTMNEEELQKKYIEQQKQIEWAKFKRNVLHEVLHHRSILPGCGKWSRNPTVKDVAHLA